MGEPEGREAEPHDHSHGPDGEHHHGHGDADSRHQRHDHDDYHDHKDHQSHSHSHRDASSWGEGAPTHVGEGNPCGAGSTRGHAADAHHGGHHHHKASQAGSAFRWGIALNSGLTALQLAIGFGFGSLALIGDSLHNLGDVIGLALGWGAERLSHQTARGRFTYGFGRSTRMVSLLNGLLIFAAGAVVVVELHVWGLSTSRTAFTAHVVVDPERLQQEGVSRDQLLAEARQRLEAFGIRKSTLHRDRG
jgi:Co/Zn/Cd efflux system component